MPSARMYRANCLANPVSPRTAARPIIVNVVTQHVEDAASLRHVRSVLVRAPHVGLLQLGRLDERIEAHLDGVRVAGEGGTALARTALEQAEVGSIFTVMVGAIERHDVDEVRRMLALRDAMPQAARAAASAVGWVSAADLRGLIAPWFNGDDATLLWLALAACAVHRVDPGQALTRWIDHADARIRLRAMQAAAELGRVDLRGACVDAAASLKDADHVLIAARAAVLLGDRGAALAQLHATALETSPQQKQATALVMLFGDAQHGRDLVAALSRCAQQDASQRRLLIQATGWSGDPKVVPWLIQQMSDLKVARLAGEAFSAISGADLARLDLENIHQPDAPPSGPTDDPAEDDVAMDEDDSLPWPKVDAIQAWWSREGSRFTPGLRHLLGERVDRANDAALVGALERGTQRVRSQAALLRCTLQPGTPLFNIAAPQRRQVRALASMRTMSRAA
jgi:uncharacterized protein (TIGR02270 family)